MDLKYIYYLNCSACFYPHGYPQTCHFNIISFEMCVAHYLSGNRRIWYSWIFTLKFSEKLSGRSSFLIVGQQIRTLYQEDCMYMYVNCRRLVFFTPKKIKTNVTKMCICCTLRLFVVLLCVFVAPLCVFVVLCVYCCFYFRCRTAG